MSNCLHLHIPVSDWVINDRVQMKEKWICSFKFKWREKNEIKFFSKVIKGDGEWEMCEVTGFCATKRTSKMKMWSNETFLWIEWWQSWKTKKVKPFDVWCFAYMNNNRHFKWISFFHPHARHKICYNTISNISNVCLEALSTNRNILYSKLFLFTELSNMFHRWELWIPWLEQNTYIHSAQHTNPLYWIFTYFSDGPIISLTYDDG